MNRLTHKNGEWIDRTREINFVFEGETYTGLAGDTISTALYGAGRRVMARSFKYHRPRSILSLANHDANIVMQRIDGDFQIPNVRADVTLIEDGMALRAVNTFGGVKHDKASILNKFSRFLPVGFYYKSFYSKHLFPMWERMFRVLTGLGRVDFSTPHQRTPKQYGFCDVLVVGGGASGLSAALAAADRGVDVVLVDENPRVGGSLTYQASDTQDLIVRVKHHPKIQVMCNTYAAGYYADNWVPLVGLERMTKMRARSVVVASGAFEQPAVFRNNDLPGIMLAGAALRLVKRYRIQPMRHAVVLAGNDDAYQAAQDLIAEGVEIVAIIDLRHDQPVCSVAQSLKQSGVQIVTGHCVTEALAGKDGSVAGVKVAAFDHEGKSSAEIVKIACDGVIVSVGYAPAANLLYQAGTRMHFDDHLQQFVPAQLPAGIFACGRVNGVHTLEHRMFDGVRAGQAAASHLGFGVTSDIVVPPERTSPSHHWPIVAHAHGKNFVDFDEDLQLKDFANAVQEGFDNIELLKRFSTNGMGPSQGKHSNMNGLRILARLTGKAPQQVGTTTARPFYHPVPMSHLAGRGFNPQRETPLQSRHEALGAVWMAAGVWQRPEYYALNGFNRTECIHQEALTVRNSVGMIDVGTLGKLEVIGPDAAAFLERVYISKYAGLKVGMTRYAVMCDESGVVIDDGVVGRLAEDHFYFTTTTSGAANIYRELSRLNTLWGLDCGIVNHTGSFAAINLAGPKSRQVLSSLTSLELDGSSFPYLGLREADVAGIPARLMRVGFVGEWGYEIHVPASYAGVLWDALMSAGASEGIRPFGVEAQRLLRLEKGHIIIGQDTDGLTTPFEAGLDWAVKMDKAFFVGQRSLAIVAKKSLRHKLVGITLPSLPEEKAPQECNLVIMNGEIAGRITSIAWSPTLACHIGLAYVSSQYAEPEGSISIRLTSGQMISARVTYVPFYDPDNRQQKEA